MLIVCNLILIGLAGLIAYWWANQGTFSALLHLLCVVVAGALAFAFWEPLAHLVLRGTFFDNYAWGVTLVGLFAIALLGLRIAMDRLAPANAKLPRWADLVFGGAAGAASGILSIGMFTIGAGHVHSSKTLLGFVGAEFQGRPGQLGEKDTLWIPFQQMTANFYGWLSVTSLSPWGDTSLRHLNPRLGDQVSLMRDSSRGGKGQITLDPDTVSVTGYDVTPAARGGNLVLVKIRFEAPARDFGEQLTLSASQARLIAAASGTEEAQVAHPIAFQQFSGAHRFDNVTHYVTSRPGEQTSSPTLAFEVPATFTPRFIQIKGVRYDLPAAPKSIGDAELLLALVKAPAAVAEARGRVDITSAIEVTNDIRPLAPSKNTLPPGIELANNNYIAEGDAVFEGRGRGGGSRELRVLGIYEPEGVRCVKLDVSRGKAADIWRYVGPDGLSEESAVRLADSTGTSYLPVGFWYDDGSNIRIVMKPGTFVQTVEELPILPTAGQQQLKLIFYITENATLTGLSLGGTAIGYCGVKVEPKRR
jgi:hypothetical protein